jgi:hypothetical protein
MRTLAELIAKIAHALNVSLEEAERTVLSTFRMKRSNGAHAQASPNHDIINADHFTAARGKGRRGTLGVAHRRPSYTGPRASQPHYQRTHNPVHHCRSLLGITRLPISMRHTARCRTDHHRP